MRRSYNLASAPLFVATSVLLAGCGGDTVRLTPYTENGTTGDCLDGATGKLERPLGERIVIDGSSGERLTVLPPD